jgi:hypothetical protein
MKFLFSSLAFFFISNLCYSNNIKKYYELINNAELKIIENDYSNAQKLYKEAFKYKKYNGKDLYNAFLCSFYIHDTLNAKLYINKLAFYGLNYDYFIPLKSEMKFYNIIFKEFNENFNAGEVKFKTSKVLTIDSLFQVDQLNRNSNNSKFNRHIIDSISLISLINTIQKNEWPSFQSNGFWNIASNPRTENLPVYILYWHNRFVNNNLDSLAIKALEKGYLRPDDFESIILGRKMFGENSFNYYDIFPTAWKIKTLTAQKIDYYNKNRDKYFLEDLSSFKKKYDYQSLYNIEFGMDTVKSSFKFLNSSLVPSLDLINQGIYD